MLFSQKATENGLLFKVNIPEDSAVEFYRGKNSQIVVLIEEKSDILTQQEVWMEEKQVRSQT